MSKDDVIAMETRLIAAIKISDITFLNKILHDDLLFIAPDGQTITKQMDLTAHKSRAMVVEELTPTYEEVKIIDDNAVVVVVYDTKGRMLGNPIEGKFRYVRVWKMFSDGLKVIAGSCCKI